MQISITMPVFNEEESIVSFLREIFFTFDDYDLDVIIIDDASTDSTNSIIFDNFQKCINKIHLIRNENNLGHGRSTVKGLERALMIKSKYIISVDGDGDISCNDLKSCLNELVLKDLDIIECVRTKRNDYWYRKIITFFCKILVFLKTLKFPKDANTPFRIYERSSLKFLLDQLTSETIIPNIFMSINARKFNMNFNEIYVNSSNKFDEFGGKSKNRNQSVTFKSRFNKIPSLKLIRFTAKAFIEWVKF
jgi:glycosyltransferase involved in cell wall biosynthesis